jgi:hypothetical protein
VAVQEVTTIQTMDSGKGSVHRLPYVLLYLRADHVETLLRLLAERQAAMKETEQELRAWLARHPREESK